MDYGTKYTQSGVNVLTSTSPRFTTGETALKTVRSAIYPLVTVAVDFGYRATLSVPHGQTFRPTIVPFAQYAGGVFLVPLAVVSPESANLDVYVTDTDVVFTAFSPGVSVSFNIFFFYSETEGL